MDIQTMKRYKKECHYTCRQISELSGVPLSTVQKVFSGATASPRMDTLQAIEDVLIAGICAPIDEDNAKHKRLKGDNGTAVSETAVIGATANDSSADPSDGSGSVWPAQGSWTIEDRERLPEERRTEIINGYLYDMASPTGVHQLVCDEILHQMKVFLDTHECRCWPVTAPFDVILGDDRKTVVQPDVLVYCSEEGEEELSVPVFIVEVLSPSTSRKDQSVKLGKYEECGVREYWMVDPIRERVLCTVPRAEDPDTISDLLEVHTFDEVLPVSVCGGAFAVDFRRIRDQIERAAGIMGRGRLFRKQDGTQG